MHTTHKTLRHCTLRHYKLHHCTRQSIAKRQACAQGLQALHQPRHKVKDLTIAQMAPAIMQRYQVRGARVQWGAGWMHLGFRAQVLESGSRASRPATPPPASAAVNVGHMCITSVTAQSWPPAHAGELRAVVGMGLGSFGEQGAARAHLLANHRAYSGDALARAWRPHRLRTTASYRLYFLPCGHPIYRRKTVPLNNTVYQLCTTYQDLHPAPRAV